MSNTLPRSKQGLAASLVNTTVNYSISIGLGLAGLIDSRLNRAGTDTLRGYRSAWYLGIGLGCAGMTISTYFIIVDIARRRRRTHDPKEHENEAESKSKAETAASAHA